MKIGAYHLANKPFNVDDVALIVEKALETTRLRREVRALRASQAQPYGFDRIVGESPRMVTFKGLLRKVAESPATTVLLTGESGTGKDLAAKVLHYNSSRANRSFMNITCSAIPEALLESELFGHERGAFTDARQQKRGLLELADGGTVFLDEIGDMVPALQSKLLRFLEEKAFKRVGGSQDISVDVRVVSATNRNLEEQVKAERFRADLYYRLNVLPIEAAAAARSPGRPPASRQLLHRSLQSRVPEGGARRVRRGAPRAGGVRLAGQHPRASQRRRAGDAAGRRAPTSKRTTFRCWRPETRVADGMALPAHGGRPRGARAQPRRSGARAERRKPDPSGQTSRPPSRSDSLPDREVRLGQALPSGRQLVARRTRADARHPPRNRRRPTDSRRRGPRQVVPTHGCVVLAVRTRSRRCCRGTS